MSQSVRCSEQQANQGRLFLAQFAHLVQRNRIRLGTPVLGFCNNLPGLIRSFAETGEDLHLHFDSAKRVAEAAVESAIARFHEDWIGATVGRYFLHHVRQRR